MAFLHWIAGERRCPPAQSLCLVVLPPYLVFQPGPGADGRARYYPPSYADWPLREGCKDSPSDRRQPGPGRRFGAYVNCSAWLKHSTTKPPCQENNSIDKPIYFLYNTTMKTKRKYTMVELAALCGYHPDTLYKSRRRGYCTWQVANRLKEVTGVPLIDWISTKAESSWVHVIKVKP